MMTAASLQAGSAELILASMSEARAAMLRAAGLTFRQQGSEVDEVGLRRRWEQDGGAEASELALILARAKACAVSAEHPQALVIGADQVLADGAIIYDKPGSRERAREQLAALRGGTHALISAVTVACGGVAVWEHVETARVSFRAFSPEFLKTYLQAVDDSVLGCIGACQIEGLGIHLFSAVEGDFFTILGMPLLPLIGYLREAGVVLA
jgi:septum formation protein